MTRTDGPRPATDRRCGPRPGHRRGFLEPYGRDKAKVRLEALAASGRTAGQADPGLGDHADPGRRGEDDDVDRPGAGPAADRQARGPGACGSRRWGRSSAARGGRPAAAPAGSSRRTRSTSSSPATSTRSPPPTTCWPRRSTTASTSATSSSTRPRSSGSASLDMNDRALRQIVIGLGGRTPGRPARERLRHHRGQRGHGDPLPGRLAGRPARTARPHPGRLHRGRRAGAGRSELGVTGVDGGDPQRGDPAQPRADDRVGAGVRPRRAVRQHRPRLQLGARHPDGPGAAPTTP